MKKNVLIIHKGDSVHTWCEDLCEAFSALGHDTKAVALRDRTLEERRIERRDGARFLDNQATVKRLTQVMSAHIPSLVILLNIACLPEPAHTAIRKSANGVPVIAWFADHIQKIPERCVPNLDAIHVFDSATLPLLREFYKHTSTHLDFLPLAVNPRRFPDCSLSWEQRSKGMVFVGNHTSDRLELIRKLKSHGSKVTCYGPRADAGWRLWRRRRMPPSATAKIYGSHQVALNILQFPNTIHGVNLRAYEIASCGGMGTYPMTPDLHHSFEPGHEIIAYQDSMSLVDQIHNLHPEKAMKLIAMSQKRILENHTYSHRASYFINCYA